MDFFKNNWIYIVIAFAVVFLVGIGYITYNRLSQLDIRETPVSEPVIATPAPKPVDEVEITFEITPATFEITDLECIELVATPLSGSVPLTVSFTGLAGDTSDSIVFNFDFGDDLNESVEKTITAETGVVTELVTHTYIKEGSYIATLTVQSENGEETSSACSIDIQAGDVSESIPSTAPTQLAQGPTISPTTTPTPTLLVATSRIPTVTTAVDVPDLPVAGSLLPTILIIVGGILILILAFAVI